MSREVNFRNLEVLVKYLENEYNTNRVNKIDTERLINEDVHKNKEYYLRKIEDNEIKKVNYEDVSNLSNWGSNEFFIELYNQIDLKSDDQNIAYDIGRYVVNSKSSLKSFFGHILGVEKIINRSPKIMSEWNNTKKVGVVKNDKNDYDIILKHKPHVIVNDFALEYHRGIFESLAEFSGAKDVSVNYEKQSDKIYLFNVKWDRVSLKDRIIQFLLKRSNFVSELIETNHQLSNEKSELERKVNDIYSNIEYQTKLKVESNMKDDMMNLVSDIISEKSEYTGNHSRRVAEYSKLIYNYLDDDLKSTLKKEDENIESNLYYAGLIHDLGKIAIPNTILEKPDGLTDEEYDIVKEHPKLLGEKISKYPSLEEIANYAYYHHERMDGKGYPENIPGEEIPYGSRILAVADTYDALTSDRPYRSELPHEDAIEIIKNSNLDEQITNSLINIPKYKISEIKNLM